MVRKKYHALVKFPILKKAFEISLLQNKEELERIPVKH